MHITSKSQNNMQSQKSKHYIHYRANNGRMMNYTIIEKQNGFKNVTKEIGVSLYIL